MSIVVLQLPDVKRKTEVRPGKCRYYQGETFQRWGRVRKPVRDSQYRSVQTYRYRCCNCRRTFRHSPQGVDRADQTQRMRLPASATQFTDRMQAGKLAAVIWVRGLSLRGAAFAPQPIKGFAPAAERTLAQLPGIRLGQRRALDQ